MKGGWLPEPNALQQAAGLCRETCFVPLMQPLMSCPSGLHQHMSVTTCPAAVSSGCARAPSKCQEKNMTRRQAGWGRRRGRAPLRGTSRLGLCGAPASPLSLLSQLGSRGLLPGPSFAFPLCGSLMSAGLQASGDIAPVGPQALDALGGALLDSTDSWPRQAPLV